MLTSSLGVVTSERLRGMTETTQFKDVRDDVMEDCRKGESTNNHCVSLLEIIFNVLPRFYFRSQCEGCDLRREKRGEVDVRALPGQQHAQRVRVTSVGVYCLDVPFV